MSSTDNKLYYGDNLDVLRRHVEDESVDLVYLDPPFKSDQDYNVLFETQSGNRSPAQIKAFEDTWRWDQAAARAYEETVTQSPSQVSQALQALRSVIGETDMLAYLSMMAPRLVELHRVLKETGSIYLHCDPAANHYLKVLMDAVFGAHFRNEIIWKRTSAHSSAKRFGPVHDVLLFYTKSENYKWNPIYQDYDQEYIESKFREDEQGRLFKDADLTGSGTRNGESGEAWNGYSPTERGRHWAVPDSALELLPDVPEETPSPHRKLELLDQENRLYYTRTGTPRLKQYLSDLPGVSAQDIVEDIPPINSQAQERLGYPTQKPVELLERIVTASSGEGDVVLDPFCGCGTAIAAAERLGRTWIGIDVTHLAISLIRHRLTDSFGKVGYEVVGEPESLEGAEALAQQDRFQFQYWALGLVNARPQEEKKGADQGIDGRIYFHDEQGGKTKQIILSVKSGKNVGVSAMRDLRGAMEREEAEVAVLITLHDPTKPMKKEAASANFYRSPGWNSTHPKLQILTIEDLLSGEGIDMPPIHQVQSRRRAPQARRSKKGRQLGF